MITSSKHWFTLGHKQTCMHKKNECVRSSCVYASSVLFHFNTNYLLFENDVLFSNDTGILGKRNSVCCVLLSNLVPRVLWLFGQRMGASRDSGEFEKISIFWLAALQRLPLFYRRNLAVTEFQYPRVSTGAHLLTKKPEDSGYEIGCYQESNLQ